MINHDAIKELEKHKQVLESISPKFNELTDDIQLLFEHSKDPAFVAALLFKLAQEREKTNKILESINDKYDKIMFSLKTKELDRETAGSPSKNSFEILPDQDQLILKYIGGNGKATAREIQSIMSYRGLNAASQRLNKLFKEGHLSKVQSGKKVLYLLKM